MADDRNVERKAWMAAFAAMTGNEPLYEDHYLKSEVM
jgi:hypothetical protein